MNLKKILAVVLSMTLLVSCLVSGMSLNTSAATPDQETAKTQLTEAWNKLYYKPVVALQGFYQKNNNVWEMRESKSDDVQEIEGLQVPCYTFTTAQDTAGAFILSGTANDIENKTNTSNFITNGSKVYFYVYDPDKNSSITDYFITSAGKNDPYYGNRTTTDVGDWRKYSSTIDNWSNQAPYLGRVQFGYNQTILDKKISAVVYEEKLVAPTDGTLLDLVKAADNVDLNRIAEGADKANFVSALAAAVEVLYTDETNTIGYLTHKWGKMSKTPEVVFGAFYDKRTGSWSENASATDMVIQGDAVKVFNPTNGCLIIMAPGATDVNQPTASINIELYDEIYLYYKSTDKEYTNVQYPSYKTAGGVEGKYSTTLSQTTGDDYYKFDIKNDIISRPDYNSNKEYYNGTTGNWFRIHFGNSDVTNQLRISQVLGVKKTVVPDTADKTLGEVIALADAEDLTTYQDNAAKTEFEAALAKANAIYLSNEDNAKAAIIAAWKKVKNNQEILFGNFHKGGGWPIVDPSGTENGIPYYANPDKGSNFIIGGSSYSSNREGFRPDEYEDFFVYIATSAAINNTYGLAFPENETNNNDQVSKNNSVTFKLSSTGGDLVKYSLKDNMKKDSAYTNQKLGRLHITSTDSAITKISYVYGVKKLNLVTAFSDVFDAEGGAQDLTLAQLINAYTKYDIENNYDAAELIATVNDVCAANPKYAAFKTVAGYANKVKEVVQVNAPTYDQDNKGITVTKVSNTSPAGVPTFDLYTVGEFGTTTFTGQGLGDLGTTNHSKGFVRYGALSTFNSNTNGLYLSYYIPSDTVPATTPIKIQVHYRGTSSTDGDTSGKTAYLKQITLTERDKWAVLDLNYLKVDGLSTLTALSNILVDVCAEAETNVTMYFSPLAFTNSANYINTAGATTLTDYAEKYNATAFTEGERYLYEADFIAARTAFNEALNSEFKISGDAIWHDGNECFYDKGDSTLATAYRTYAQYTCPIEKGQPVLDKVVVDGQSYNLVSRSILIARSADGTFGTLDMSTDGAKWVTTIGDDLSAKYWSVADNGDGTATVTYSMLLKDVSKENAESKYHMTRAMIEYTDGEGNTVQVYSKPREHGTIKDTFNYAHGNNNNLQWFPQVNN